MLRVVCTIEVVDPDGVPPAGTGYFIQEAAARGVYPLGQSAGDEAYRTHTMIEDVGVAIHDVSKQATDLALEAVATLAKQTNPQGGG